LDINHCAGNVFTLMHHGDAAYSLNTFIQPSLTTLELFHAPYGWLVDKHNDSRGMKRLNGGRIRGGVDPDRREYATWYLAWELVYGLKRGREYVLPVVECLRELLALLNTRIHVILLLVGGKIDTSTAYVDNPQAELIWCQVIQTSCWSPDCQHPAPFAERDPRILADPAPPSSPSKGVPALAVVVLRSLDPEDASQMPFPCAVTVGAVGVKHFIRAYQQGRCNDFP
jgi:hypothetical protein